MSHWYDSTPKKSRCKRDSNPGSSALEADALPLGQRGGHWATEADLAAPRMYSVEKRWAGLSQTTAGTPTVCSADGGVAGSLGRVLASWQEARVAVAVGPSFLH